MHGQGVEAARASVVMDWIDRIQSAHQQGLRVRIRGAGSKDFYAPVMPDGAEVLDTRALRGIIDYEPSELVVCVRAGTPLVELETLLAAHGQCLPFEPPHFGAATVGGMVAAGLAGPARADAGSVRDHVLGVQMINGRGELLNFGGTVIKNVAGYDVSRVLAGSLGTLGVMTHINLKVLPQPPAQATLRFAWRQPDALGALYAWCGQPLPLNASSWHKESAGDGGVLHVRLRGARAAVETACQQMGGERLDKHAAAAHWHGCREQILPWFQAARDTGNRLWRLSVPQTTGTLDLAEIGDPIPFVEWHGGQFWIAIGAEDARKAAETVHTGAARAGGHATLFRAGKPDKADKADNATVATRFQPLPAALFAIHQRLKREFDPSGVFPDLPWKEA